MSLHVQLVAASSDYKITPISEHHLYLLKLRTVGERDGPDFRTSATLRVLNVVVPMNVFTFIATSDVVQRLKRLVAVRTLSECNASPAPRLPRRVWGSVESTQWQKHAVCSSLYCAPRALFVAALDMWVVPLSQNA